MAANIKTLARRAKQRFAGQRALCGAAFDRAYYLRAYPDVAASGIDPLDHYLSVGWAETRNPHPLFDAQYYLDHNPDVAHAGLNPLLHYLERGAFEGRSPSALFDGGYYVAAHLDVARAGVAPLAHFIAHGAAEGREANPLFDSAWYLARYPEAAREAASPLAHYAEHGLERGLSPHPLFDGAWYLENHPDVAQAGMNPLAHYQMRGREEQRRPHALFDAAWYLAGNPDVAAANVEPLRHYLELGAHEGRNPNSLFDGAFYVDRNAVPSGVNPLVHYVTTGAAAGAQPHPLFDGRFYLERYPDVAEAGLNPLAHYLMRGASEARDPHPLFDTAWYLENNPDVQAAGVNPLVHYIGTGWREGREPNPAFNGEDYLAANPDVRAADICPLVHLGTSYAAERQSPTPQTSADPAASERAIIAPYFDVNFYLSANPDVAAAGVDPLTHYHETGWREGRAPNRQIDWNAYLAKHPHLRSAGICPLVEFVNSGAAQALPLAPAPSSTGNRTPSAQPQAQAARGAKNFNPGVGATQPPQSPGAHIGSGGEREMIAPYFDAGFYRFTYPDVAEAGIDPLFHYHETGWREGRRPNSRFDGDAYLAEHPEARAENICPLVHAVRSGHPLEIAEVVRERSAMEPYFDAHFYAATNSDLVGIDDLLGHFMSIGWKQGRDPSPGFSLAFYLTRHVDVKRAGINPFLHYRTVGMLEGRAIKRSSVRRQSDVHLSKTGAPRLAVLAMVKNEIDIIEAFAAHVLALFDSIVIIDHGSEDGTREYLQGLADRYANVAIYDLKEPSYVQALAMNFMVENCPELRGADWVFLLDADEFLPIESRSELHAALVSLRSFPVIEMHWRNVTPVRYWEHKADLSDGAQVMWPADPSPYTKIAFQPALLKGRKFWIDQGNHAILGGRDGEALHAAPAGFDLIHLPVRSETQLSLKLNQGVLSYLQLGRERRKPLGSHWFAILEELKDKRLTPELLNGVATNYGEKLPLKPVSAEELLAKDATIRPLRIALENINAPKAEPRKIAELLFKIGGGYAEAEPSRTAPTKLEFRENNEIHGIADATPYKTLPASEPEQPAEQSDLRFLADFLRPSFWEYADLTFTAWSGHLPFMFSIVTLLRPRRYVELGSHFGASFFAFCQAAKRAELGAQAVAIDCWEGDEHTGEYDATVFEQFCSVLQNYDEIGEYLRMYFAEAAVRFEPGSIDLLHIDGLHTYEAVRSDFETWLPKMSDRGVVLFHDINVHERDFGVWRFWKELKKRYPTMEFRHGHGLGLVYVGKAGASPVERLIAMMNGSDEAADLLQQHFEDLSQKSSELYTSRVDLEQRDAQLLAVGLVAEELTRLRQEISVLRQERDQLLNVARTPLGQ